MSFVTRIFRPACSLLILISTANIANAVEPGAPTELLTKEVALAAKLREKLSAPYRIRSEKLRESYLLFYEKRGFKKLWVSDGKLTEAAKQVIKEIPHADEYGLDGAKYKVPSIAVFDGEEVPTIGQLAEVEAAISIAVVNYTRHAKGGRLNPRRISSYLDFKLNLPSPKKVLAGIDESEDAGKFLRKQHPQRWEFEALRKQYAALLGTKPKRMSGPTPLPLQGPTLKLGVSHPDVAKLRQALNIPPDIFDDEEFDETVLRAVRKFQRNNNLAADGVVGRGTRAFINGVRKRAVPRTSQATRLLVNMERWRWYPDDFGDYYITMNIPEQIVRVYKDRKKVHEAITIIGKIKNQTVVFSDTMDHLVFNPTWNMPNSIKVEEILPYLQKKASDSWFTEKDPGILARHNLFMQKNGVEIDPSTINWQEEDIRSYRIYQKPGPKNVLGIVKFMFPNRHAIYMHDTTEKQYFKNPVRLHSHGCVRIKDPAKFASVLLNKDRGWNLSNVNRIVANPASTTVRLKRKIPVHLTYFTTWVDETGRVKTGPDVYGHDVRMACCTRTLKTGFRSFENTDSSEKEEEKTTSGQ